MIKKLMGAASLVLAIVIGGVGADFLRSKSSAPKQESHKSKSSKKDKKSAGKKQDGEHGAKKKKKKKKSKKGDKGKKGEKEGSADKLEYMKFKRQFVVPIMDGGQVKSLILLNLNLELGKGAPANYYSLEPKLRDVMMRELLKLSHDGVFSSDLTSTHTYDAIREALLDAAKTVIKDGVENVLILDLMRQDQ